MKRLTAVLCASVLALSSVTAFAGPSISEMVPESVTVTDVVGELPAEHRVVRVAGVVLRFVPDFPIGDLHLEPVRPALGVVADHVLADARPLREILGRVDVHRRVATRHEVLDRHAEAEERLGAVRVERLQERVRVGETVALRVVLVGVEVREEIRYINIETATEPAADVVQPRIRDSRLLEVVHHRPVAQRTDHRRLPYAVNALHRPDGLAEVNLHLRCVCAEGHGRHSQETESDCFFHACSLRLFADDLLIVSEWPPETIGAAVRTGRTRSHQCGPCR